MYNLYAEVSVPASRILQSASTVNSSRLMPWREMIDACSESLEAYTSIYMLCCEMRVRTTALGQDSAVRIAAR